MDREKISKVKDAYMANWDWPKDAENIVKVLERNGHNISHMSFSEIYKTAEKELQAEPSHKSGETRKKVMSHDDDFER